MVELAFAFQFRKHFAIVQATKHTYIKRRYVSRVTVDQSPKHRLPTSKKSWPVRS